MPRAAPSREAPSATNDQEAGVVLKLGEYAEEPTLNTSEARMIILKTLATRAQNGANTDEVETLVKTKDYLEIFAVFKELAEATQVEGIINVYGRDLEKFEKSQIGVQDIHACEVKLTMVPGTLVPASAEEAVALIPSLERKVEQGKISMDELEEMCIDLQRLRRQAELGS